MNNYVTQASSILTPAHFVSPKHNMLHAILLRCAECCWALDTQSAETCCVFVEGDVVSISRNGQKRCCRCCCKGQRDGRAVFQQTSPQLWG